MKNIGSVRATYDLLASEAFHIKKRFGQNFLADKNILEKIAVESGITEDTDVIEIGPGFGALTEVLLPRAKRVLAYEIDHDLIPILKKNFLGEKKLIVLNQDILEADIDADIQTYLPGATKVAVVANLPYYITTPILMRFLETSVRVGKLVLMMQSEVADRVTSLPNSKDYNALTVVINYRAETKILFPVPRTVFIPQPAVDSAVVMITLRDEIALKPADEAAFFTFVHQCFVQRRKTLLNNLRPVCPTLERSALETLLTEGGLNPNIRADALEIADFIRLFDAVTKKQ